MENSFSRARKAGHLDRQRLGRIGNRGQGTPKQGNPHSPTCSIDQTRTGVHPADLQREGGTDGELRESDGGERRRKPDGREEQTDRQGGKKKNQRGPERPTDTAGGRRHTLVNR